MTRIKYLIFPVIFFLIFSFFFSQSRVFAGSYSSEKQVGSTTNTCSVNISWKEYRGQRKIYYGNWDGTYTVFLYRSGEDRDHYLARRVTSDTRVRIENLPAGSSYVAEVFLTGAFLNPDVPYWAKLSSFPCNQTSLQKIK